MNSKGFALSYALNETATVSARLLSDLVFACNMAENHAASDSIHTLNSQDQKVLGDALLKYRENCLDLVNTLSSLKLAKVMDDARIESSNSDR